MQFTNLSKDFKGTLDYILYTNDSLVPCAVLDLPEEGDMQRQVHKLLASLCTRADLQQASCQTSLTVLSADCNQEALLKRATGSAR